MSVPSSVSALPPGTALVALGSNLGDSRALLAEALQALRDSAAGDFRASSLWASDPVDCPPGSPPFVNAVAWMQTAPHATPETTLALLQSLERRFGRRPKQVLNEPRPLDLDLLGFGAESRSTPELTLPHPRAHLRRFVLAPLSEIAPDLRLPGWAAAAQDLLLGLPPGQEVRRLQSAAGTDPVSLSAPVRWSGR